MTLTEIHRKLAELSNEARKTDQTAHELQVAAREARQHARILKERSDSVQRKLASSI
jgi:hypothetical protein